MPKFLDSPQWYENTGSQATAMPIIETTETNPDNLPKDKNAVYVKIGDPWELDVTTTGVKAKSNQIQVTLTGLTSSAAGSSPFVVQTASCVDSPASIGRVYLASRTTTGYAANTWTTWAVNISAPITTETVQEGQTFLCNRGSVGTAFVPLPAASQTTAGVAKIYKDSSGYLCIDTE